MSQALDCTTANRVRMIKGEERLYLDTNVFTFGRARKGNRIRQGNRISIISMLTGRNVVF